VGIRASDNLTSRSLKEKKERKRKLEAKNLKSVHMYILPTQTRPVTCYRTDPSSREGGCPTTNKTAIVLTTGKIWS
jgi:hypothetical protein